MRVVSNHWFDRVLLPILYILRPWRWPMFRPPSLGPPLFPLKCMCEFPGQGSRRSTSLRRTTAAGSRLAPLYIYIYIRMCIHTYTCLSLSIYIYIHIHIHMNISLSLSVYIYTYIPIHIHTYNNYAHTHMYVCM